MVRAVEVVCALDEALRLIAEYQPPPRPCVDVPPLRTRHRRVDPGSHHRPSHRANQDVIEDDLLRLVTRNLHLDDAHLTALREQAFRNYDPCISCSAHFLRLRIEHQ